jgi:gliding motility-associated-like protein
MQFSKLIIQIFIILFSVYNACDAQTYYTSLSQITEGNSMVVPCSNPCPVLHAQYPKPLKTNTYNVVNIPYSYNSIAGTALNLGGDDTFSGAIPIGFQFCFFNNIYTNIYISDNGQLTFNSAYNHLSASFATQTAIPYFNSSFPDNAIFGPFVDLKLSLGGSISYKTTGTAPFRKFTVQYNNAPYFNNNCTGVLTNTFQIVLHETFNYIDCIINNKNQCNTTIGNWLNYGTIGIQNASAAIAFAAPGRNASIWAASNEAWRFEPAGAPNYSFLWFENNTQVASNVDSITSCMYTGFKKVSTVLQIICPNYKDTDAINLTKYVPIIDSVKIIKPNCINDTNGIITAFGHSIAMPMTYALNNNAFSSNNVLTGVGAAFNTIHFMDANGCIIDTVILIKPKSEPKIKVDSIFIDYCPTNSGGALVTAYNGQAPYTYLWNNGDADSFLNNVQGGSYYTITATDVLGCTSSKLVYVPQKNLPAPTFAITPSSCGLPNGAIDLTLALPGNYIYTWSNGAITQDISGQISGYYSVTIAYANGCDTLFYFQIPNKVMAQTYSNTPTKCGLNNGALNIVSTINAAPPITYSLNGTATSPPFNNLAAGVYTLIATDSGGCILNSNFTIAQSLKISDSVLKASAHCDSTNGLIKIVPYNNTGSCKYIWSNGIIDTNIIYNLAPTYYWVTIIDSIGCEKTDTIQIKDDGSPHLSIIDYKQPSCYGDSNGIINLTGNLGISPYKYSTDGSSFSAVAQINNISGGLYKIFIRDASGCVRDTIVTFQQPDSIKITNKAADTVACFGDVINGFYLNATGGHPPFLYKMNSGLFDTSQIFNNISGGYSTFTVKDSTNCTKQLAINFATPTGPVIATISASDIACYQNNTGKVVLENVTGGWMPYIVNWVHDTNIINLVSATEGKYIVTVTDIKNCSYTDSIQVNQLQCCLAVIPNAFTPDNNGLNDYIHIKTYSEILNVRLQIYDRFGTNIFTAYDPETKWYGTFDNLPCDVGTYFYLFEYKCPFNNKVVQSKGDILLIR